MKYRSIAHPTMVLFVFVFPFSILIIPTILFCFVPNDNSFVNGVFISILYVVISTINAIFYHNAFVPFEMNLLGLKNNKWNINWEDINHIEILEVDLLKFSLLPTIKLSSVICIGTVQKGNFIFQSSRKCIFFAMSSKNLKFLKNFAKGKSKVVDEFLNVYFS